MSTKQEVRNGEPQESSNATATERTPLLSPPTSSGGAPIDAAIAINSNAEETQCPHGSDRLVSHDRPPQSIGYVRAGLSAVALACLIFLQATNISLLTTTQSAIAQDLDAFEQVSWFTSAYIIAMSALGPLNGKLASLFSPRSCIFVSSIAMACGVCLCSAATNFATFVCGRALTGAGASGIFTVSMIISMELSSPERRGLAIGLVNSGYTSGVAIGATLAGALLSETGWRALFWMQAPLALFGGIVLLFTIPSTFRASNSSKLTAADDVGTLKKLAKLDYLGAVTLTAGLVLMLYALSAPKAIPVLPIVMAVVVLTTFVLNEVYLAYDPVIPVTLLRSRGLLLTCLATVGYMMARWTVLFYAPTYAIAVRQWSPATAGSILIPTNGGFAIGGLLVGALHIRRPGSYYVATVIAYTIFPITLLLLSRMASQDSNPWIFVLTVFVNGATTGAALNYNLAHLLHLTPRSTHYVATSLLATFRGFAGSFASAVGGGIFSRTLYNSLEDGFAEYGEHPEHLIRRLLGSPALVGSLNGTDKDVAVQGYTDALGALWLAGAGLAALMVLIQAGTGWAGAEEKESVLEHQRQRMANGEPRQADRSEDV